MRLRPSARAHHSGHSDWLYIVAALVLVAAILHPSDGTAQTLIGTVLDERQGTPVAGATIVLVDRSGEPRAQTISDSRGSFILTPPRTGDYVVEASRFGYVTTRSPLFALQVTGNVAVEITMTPSPIGIEGFSVSVEREAEQLLGPFGLTPDELGSRWISRDDIERMPSPVGPREVIRWRNIAGLWVEPEIITPRGGPQLCVRIRQRGCALIYLNGVLTDPQVAQAVNPYDLEGIAILRPVEATTFYGTGANNGVILMWTRAGGG